MYIVPRLAYYDKVTDLVDNPNLLNFSYSLISIKRDSAVLPITVGDCYCSQGCIIGFQLYIEHPSIDAIAVDR